MEGKPVQLENHPLKESALKIRIHKLGAQQYGEVGFTLGPGKGGLLSEIKNMEVTEDDLWIVTYPRSGTTWTQEILWNIRNGVDPEKSKKVDIDSKFHFLDMDFFDYKEGEVHRNIENAKRCVGEERNIKTHLPFTMLPANLLKKAKVVYVARNPKDVVVSYYHHQRLVRSTDPSLDFDNFVRLFMAELLPEDPYVANIKEGWAAREEENVIFVWYEDMKKDLCGSIQKLARFLGKELSEEDLALLVDHVEIKNMKKNPAVNHLHCNTSGRFLETESFIRKGETGGWRKYFSAELEAEFDAWIEEQFAGSDIVFQYQ